MSTTLRSGRLSPSALTSASMRGPPHSSTAEADADSGAGEGLAPVSDSGGVLREGPAARGCGAGPRGAGGGGVREAGRCSGRGGGVGLGPGLMPADEDVGATGCAGGGRTGPPVQASLRMPGKHFGR